jgi:hypothetical protein
MGAAFLHSIVINYLLNRPVMMGKMLGSRVDAHQLGGLD